MTLALRKGTVIALLLVTRKPESKSFLHWGLYGTSNGTVVCRDTGDPYLGLRSDHELDGLTAEG